MTISMDAGEVMTAAGLVSILAILVIGWIVYLMVRPSRRARRRERPTEMDALQAGEMLRLMERMEQRLEVLERAIGDERSEPRVLERGAQGAEDRRMR